MENKYKEQIWDLLRIVQNKPRTKIREYCKACGLTQQEALLIREISGHPEITTVELSQILGISKSTISSMINRLEDDGIVIREVPKHNRRITLLRISPEYGKRPEIVRLKANLINSLFKEITEEDAEIIMKGLRRLEALMNTEIEEQKEE